MWKLFCVIKASVLKCSKARNCGQLERWDAEYYVCAAIVNAILLLSFNYTPKDGFQVSIAHAFPKKDLMTEMS